MTDVSAHLRDPAEDPFGLVERVLYRDGVMLVLDKPAGVAVHRGPKGGATLEEGFDALRFGLPKPPGLAHRLDKDTSGCLVLGRHHKALALLGGLFAEGAVGKTYWAVVAGGPQADAGTIDAPLKKRDERRGWWMAVDPAGQTAITDFAVLGRGSGLAWLALTPRTGRTHQLRAHCAHLGMPILGDPIYGRASANGPRLQLHARAVSIPLKRGAPPVVVTAPVPEHMRAPLSACGWTGEEAGRRPDGATT
jgi:tRNA pseudouridine32 synthase/23S rRNA pseudouridine746 synthase